MKLLKNIYNLLVPKNKLLLLLIVVVLLLALGYLFKMMEEDDESEDEDEIEGMRSADDDPELNDALQLRENEEPILPEGPRGNIGIRGKTGEAGPVGGFGMQGDQGDQGDQGIKGDKGVQGVKGDKGVKGDRGRRGLRGPVDERAFSIAMSNKNQMADLAARAAAAEATAAAALSKASMPPRKPKPRRYTYVGEGGCHNNKAIVKAICRSKSNCEFVGQQSNGCWHLLKGDSNGASKRSTYTRGFYRV